MILLNNVSFAYRKGRPVVKDLTMRVQPGSICGLLGPNGVGKSTILYLISGLLRQQQGEIECNGHAPADREVSFLNDIFIVPEEFSLPAITLEQYLRVNAPFYPKYSEENMEKYLEAFSLPMDLHLGKLSMGQKKKVFLSFALACNTSVLLFDEPTNGLDIPSKRIFRQLVSAAMNDEKSFVISTHQVYDVEKILDHVVIADLDGVKLNESIATISSRLRFAYTNDPHQAQAALLAINSLGGFNVVEVLQNPDMETEVNLESLFELVQKRPEVINSIFAGEN